MRTNYAGEGGNVKGQEHSEKRGRKCGGCNSKGRKSSSRSNGDVNGRGHTFEKKSQIVRGHERRGSMIERVDREGSRIE